MKSQSTQYVAVLYLCIFAILLCVLSHTTAWTCHFRYRSTMQSEHHPGLSKEEEQTGHTFFRKQDILIPLTFVACLEFSYSAH